MAGMPNSRGKEPHLQPGCETGEYRIIRELGRGGMAEVYEAEHVRLGSRHAVKFFAYGKEMGDVRKRFLAEGKLLARLSHPRIVRVTDTGTDPGTGRPYFVMDLVTDPEGKVRSLADVPSGAVDEGQVALWYDDLREGLAYIHGKGIIHRDLKLENILIGPDGHVVLTDFGISKIVAAKDGDAVVDPVRTVVRLQNGKAPLMGSIGYMAPELEMGVAASPQSDYYALGVIVFRLLTGTWCDSRTDVVGILETYDPVWRQIVPNLLHANPCGRACVAWHELKREDEERRLQIAEVNVERMRNRMKRAAWLGLTACAMAVAGLVLWGGGILSADRSAGRRLPTFDEVVFVPADAPVEESEEHASREQLNAALPDAWVLAHGIFSGLYAGAIPWTTAIGELNHLATRASQDDPSLFDQHPLYMPSGESAALAELLGEAVRRMRERQGRR